MTERRDPEQVAFARRLRRELTDAERRLWTHLRAGRLAHMRFRRQEPLGPYVVDFVSRRCRLIIELDGGQHNEEDERKRDRARTDWLQTRGYRVLRFWDNEVLLNTEGVLEVIRENLLELTPSPPHRPSACFPGGDHPPHPDLLPNGEKENTGQRPAPLPE